MNLFKNRMRYYYKHREAIIILNVLCILIFFVASFLLNLIDFLTSKLN